MKSSCADHEFTKKVRELPRLLKQLLRCEPMIVGDAGRFPDKPGIYLINDDLYVGRCKSLRRRMRNHGGKSAESSTFAFRMACAAIGRKATYRKGEGRKVLMKKVTFRKVFHGNVEKIRAMKVQFVEIDDPVTQYLMEVYVHLALKTHHNSFGTH